MIGYLVIFVAAVVAFTLVIQGTYKKAPLFAKYPVLDEILGGLLGVVQGFLLLLFVVIILDQYYLYTNIPPDSDDESGSCATFWDAINTSNTGDLLHGTVIPAFLAIFGFLIPARCTRSTARMTSGPGADGLPGRTHPDARDRRRSRASCSPATRSTRPGR